jgi:DNA-binding NtrC family response regulator
MNRGGNSLPALEVLIVDDDDDLREAVCEAMQASNHSVHDAADGAAALKLAQARRFDVVVTDVQMPKLDGMALFQRLKQLSPETEVIFMTSHGDVAQAVAAMKDGANDYLAKPFQPDELVMRLGRIAARRALERDLEQARAALSNLDPGAVLVGQSAPVRRLLALIETVAKTDAATLITGESGTGKELVARMLHDLGPRRESRFVVLNCGALTENLIEAELFGHERGAFTGADRKREGRFKAADRGTLFLDEVAELPLPAQAKLLRVLQEGTFEPIGTSTPEKVDVRIVSATHRDLKARIREGLFREDLFYRINVIEIGVPPLRERPGDLPLLVQHFLKRFAPPDTEPSAITPEAWAALSQHGWPGNVRELAHAIQHAVVLAGGKAIDAEHLPAALAPRLPPDGPDAVPVEMAGAAPVRPLGEVVRAFERQYLARVLAQTNAKRGRLAEALGISRKTLWEKMRAYGIDASAESGEGGTGNGS